MKRKFNQSTLSDCIVDNEDEDSDEELIGEDKGSKRIAALFTPKAKKPKVSKVTTTLVLSGKASGHKQEESKAKLNNSTLEFKLPTNFEIKDKLLVAQIGLTIDINSAKIAAFDMDWTLIKTKT